MKPITHMVFGGNALRTLCLCGILRYIYFYNLDAFIRDVSGTSMGAFFALAFALKIPIEQLEQMIYKVCKDKNIATVSPSSFINIMDNYGVGCSLNYLIDIKQFIKDNYNQDDMTFLELSKKTGVNLYVSATNINNTKNTNFNVNNTPNISIIDAVAASMCVPLLSKPIIIDGYYYIDGYLTDNFPLEIFKDIPREQILGVAVNVENDYLIPPIEKGTELSFINYIVNIFFTFYNNTYKLCYYNKINSYNDFLIIKSSPIKSIFKPNINEEEGYIDFSLKEEDINNLFLQGFKEINDYMNKYNYCNSNVDLVLCDKSSNFQEI